MAKLCKIVKKDFLKKHEEEYEQHIVGATYWCTKCGRAANSKSVLCKPKKIEAKKQVLKKRVEA